LEQNPSIKFIFDQAKELNMPNWYLGAGGVAQTVWNVLHRFDPENGIKDYDLVYFNDSDLSYEAEDAFIKKGEEIFKDISVPVEIRNQARVHLWYEKHFGAPPVPLKPYRSVEEAIDQWPTTATAMGIRKEEESIKVYAPFGLDDMLNMIVRANKVKITKQIYLDKVNRWISVWPKLKIVSWEDS
jgi:uncharacterized protein